MPIIQTYQERVSAQGSLNTRADGEAFGAGVARAKVAEAESESRIGAAIQNVGVAAGNYASRMQKIDEDTGRLWAAKTSADLQFEMQQDLVKQTETADPRDPNFKNFAPDFAARVEQRATELAEAAPNQHARDTLTQQASQLRNQMFSHAASVQASLNGQYLKELAEQGLETDQKLVQSDPSNENFRAVVERNLTTVEGMQTNGVDREKWKNNSLNKLAVSQVQAVITKGPGRFLSAIGRPPKLATGPAVQSGAAQEVAANQPTLPNDEFGQMATKAGLSGMGLQLARSIFEQESRSGKARTDTPNYAGANGPMQVTRSTFEGLKANGSIPQSADFNNPKDTTNAGLVLLSQLYNTYGDAEKAAAAYYAGPKAIRSDGSLNYAIRDLKNPNAPTVGGYVAKVMSRLGPTDPGAELASAPPAAIVPSTDEEIASSLSEIAGWEYLTAEQRVQAVRMAESQVSKDVADDRAALEREIKDRMAMIADGKVPPDLTNPRYSKENLVRVFGADVGSRTAEAVQYQISVSNATASVRTMTPAQIASTAETLAPTSQQGYADKSRAYAAFLKAADQVEQYRQKHPMQWAIENGVNGVKPIDFDQPDAMSIELKNRVIAATNLAKNYGAKPQILTPQEADVFTRRLDVLAPADKIQVLQSVRASFGQDTQGQALFQSMMGQVSEKTPMVGLVANLTSKVGSASFDGVRQDANAVAERIMEGEYILRGGKLGDATNTSKPSDFDEAVFKSNFNRLLGNAFKNLDGQTSAKVMSQAYQAAKNYLASDAFRSGVDLKSASANAKLVEKAVSMTVGPVWKRSSAVGDDDRLVAPWGYPAERFQSEFNTRAQAAIDAAGWKGTNLDSLDSYSFDNVGDGVYAFRYQGRYLVGKDGKQVVVDYSKPMQVQTVSRGATGSW